MLRRAQQPRITVDPEDRSARTDEFGGDQRNIAAAATDIKNLYARGNPGIGTQAVRQIRPYAGHGINPFW